MDVTLSRRAVASGLIATPAASKVAAAQSPKPRRSPRWAPVDEVIDRVLAAREAPGVVVMAARGDEVLYARAAGMANLETGSPMTLNSVCRIGSITKQFTAAAVMLLAEDGKLSLDDPLARFIPDFPRAERLPLRRMLNHTAGLGNYTAVKLEKFLQESRLDYDDDAMLKVVRDTDPLFLYEPGNSWRYSNNDYVLLGLVVAKASGQPYKEFMRSRVLNRAGLRETAVDDAADIVPGRASGYSPDKATASVFHNASFVSMTYPGAAGCLRSTGPDLIRWAAALHGGRVLSAEHLKAMLSPTMLNDGTLPKAKNAPGMPDIYYGFGVSLEPVRGHVEVRHSGGIQGFYSDLRTYPDLGVSFVVLNNGDGAAGAKPNEAIGAAIQRLLLA